MSLGCELEVLCSLPHSLVSGFNSTAHQAVMIDTVLQNVSIVRGRDNECHAHIYLSHRYVDVIALRESFAVIPLGWVN